MGPHSFGKIPHYKAMPARLQPPAKSGPSGEPSGLDVLLAKFDRIAGLDGMISKDEVQQHMPEGPDKDALLKHFHTLLFGRVEDGRPTWSNMSRAELARLAKEARQAGGLEAVAQRRAGRGLIDRQP